VVAQISGLERLKRESHLENGSHVATGNI